MRLLLASLAAAGAVLGGLLASSSGADTPARARAAALVASGTIGPQHEAAVSGDRTERRTGGVATELLTIGSGEAIARGQVTGRSATAHAAAVARSVDAFGGRVLAYGVRREITDTASGTVYEGRVSGLRIDGRMIGDVTADQAYELDGGGSVIVNRGGVGLMVRRPDGTELRIAVVSARARQGRVAPRATPTPTATPKADRGAEPRKRSKRARKRAGKRRKPTPVAPARLRAGGYAFPVFSPEATLADDFGGPRQIGPHQGNDIFAPFGSPVLAVTGGVLRKVGTLPISGNRLWLEADGGEAYFYAHLSAFSPLAESGRRVKAGDVVGFVGNTGDAEPTPPHVHFEVHPGGRETGAADPRSTLLDWRRRQDVVPTEWLRRNDADTRERPGTLVEVRDFIAGE